MSMWKTRCMCSRADLTCLQEVYLQQYMAQVAAIQQRQAEARTGQLTPQAQQELKTLKHELAAAEGS